MVSTFSPNIQLEEPARGDQVGVWDTPVNANMTLIDLIVGGVTTISGAAGSVTLAAAQYQCKTITFNSTLIASITVTFPTSFKKSYEIQNQCTGSSAFLITLQTTASGVGGQYVCCPPGEIIDVLNDGTNIKYKSLGRVGEYMDIAGSSMPNWISGCAVAPYLNCDGTAFSSATYPALAARLGGTTLPDARGRSRFALDAGVGRLSSGVSGMSSVGTGGGSQSITLGSTQLPASIPYTDPNHSHTLNSGSLTVFGGTNIGAYTGGANALFTQPVTAAAAIGITINPAGSGGGSGIVPTVPPAYIGGLTLIRAA
jgi:microcystin-dependent protein